MVTGTPKSSATAIDGKTISGFELRGQTSGNDFVEYIGEITSSYDAYIYSSTFDMNSSEVNAILGSIAITVN